MLDFLAVGHDSRLESGEDLLAVGEDGNKVAKADEACEEDKLGLGLPTEPFASSHEMQGGLVEERFARNIKSIRADHAGH